MSTTPGQRPDQTDDARDDLAGGKRPPRDPDAKPQIGYEPLTEPLAGDATSDGAP
ncbi:MAG: hypothetical protein IPK37_19440 [Austwickia sp.]|jgi:hypothetical protein|nr:MAG: hypothetical protein IPK37_19440 [Austwickia sp.]